MLCFQAKTRATAVELPSLATNRAVQEVAAVELNTRFGRQHFQHSSTRGLEYLGSNLQPSFLGPFQRPIMVVSFPEL